ncbi:type II secretion system F family protein [uncultured Halovibrio sp.]|uniref:type II secretion system F family protein n=1 Tax=uncultured Halovibrio sp. TaxID=985049 RepID=UPI0025CBE845|nr:type II secretion system F family protein [uncultured Halovibrio sp.]
MTVLMWIAIAMIGAGLAGLVYLVFGNHRRAVAVRRLHQGRGSGNQRSGGDRRLKWLAQLDSRLTQVVGHDPELAPLLIKAGWRSREAVAIFRGIQNGLVLLSLVSVFIYWLALGFEGAASFVGLFSFFVPVALAYLGPKLALRRLAHQRQRRIREEVSGLLHLLRVLFDAGLGFDQALVTIARENRRVIPEVAGELEAVMRQVETGADRAETLSSMARDLDVDDLTDLVRLLRQVDRYGGAIQKPLMEFANLLEERRRTEVQEKVGKLSGAMTVVMVLFFLPALMILMAGPGFISILEGLGSVD